MRSSAVSRHYDALIDENNDSFHDSPELAAYMDKWDGQKLLDMLAPKAEQTVLEIGVGTGLLRGAQHRCISRLPALTFPKRQLNVQKAI